MSDDAITPEGRDPAAPLEAFLGFVERRADSRFVEMSLFGPALTLGDLRAAVAALRDRADEVARLRAEVEGLRGDLGQALRMFSKRTWVGRLDMPREFHERRGRVMAGLPPAPGPGAGGGGRDDDSSSSSTGTTGGHAP